MSPFNKAIDRFFLPPPEIPLTNSLIEKLYALQHRVRMRVAAISYFIRHGNEITGGTTAIVPQNLALVLAGLIGDSVMCTPVISESRRAWPEARITVIGMRHNCELLAGCHEIDAVYELAAEPFTLRRRAAVRSFRQWLALQEFDAAIILLGDEFALELADAKIPVRAGVLGHPLSHSLTHVYNSGLPRSWGPEEKLNSLRVLGCDVCAVPPRLWITGSARQEASAALAGVGIGPEDEYAVIHPFGRTASQWWPAPYCNLLAPLLEDTYGWKLLLVGRSGLHFSERFAPNLIDARGRIGLRHLPAVFERAALVISTDSGPFHIAGALGRPLVGLFRSARPEYSLRYRHARVVLGKDDACGRCTGDRCRKLPCRQMAAITITNVMPAIESTCRNSKE
jgi:ADP-heptose:LPS heptosyltransferase